MAELIAVMRQHRVASLATADTLSWLAAFLVFSFVRYALDSVSLGEAVARTPWLAASVLACLAAALHLGIGWAVRLHHGRSMVGSLEEMLALGPVVSGIGALVTCLNLFAVKAVPGSVPLGATFFALVTMSWYRAGYRAWRERHFRWHRGSGARWADSGRVIVFGAGEAGRQLVNSMFREPGSNWRPVAVLDDDRGLRHRRIRGVPVRGGREAIADVASETGAQSLIIAIPSASSAAVRELSDAALAAGLKVKVLPGTQDLLDSGAVDIADVRDIDVTDLLGRHQIDTDIESIAGYLTGRRVLVTGAGGSIGSELCRQIARFAPAELIMLDRDESALHAVQLSIYGQAMLDTDDVVLADIRDALYMDALFDQRKPEVVFHAAALKHLPMLEQYPGEAIKTNVWGTLAVLDAARNHGVDKFVNISTDKAANPISVLGYSKRLAEGLTSSVASDAEGTFLSVRFGNVLGSRGSVLTAFASQIGKGEPVTVTDPGVTRYFMTVQEAVQLVIQAAAIGRRGEALVLDMGNPVSIDALARQLIDISGKRTDVIYTGLRTGEKMHEELWGRGETDCRPVHPLVSHTAVPVLHPVHARELDPWCEPHQVVRGLVEAVARMESECQGAASSLKGAGWVV